MKENYERARKKDRRKNGRFVLVATGAIGASLSLLDLFTEIEGSLLRNISTITLLVVSATAVSIGLERWLRFTSIDDQLTDIRQLLQDALDNTTEATGIENAEDIYLKVMTIVKESDRMIRGTAFGEPSAPRIYLETLAEKLRSNRNVVFRIVTGYTGTTRSPKLYPAGARAAALLERKRVLEQVRAWKQVNVRAVPVVTAPDFVIVDDHSILIPFPTIAEDPSLQRNPLQKQA